MRKPERHKKECSEIPDKTLESCGNGQEKH